VGHSSTTAPPLTCARPEADDAARRKNFHLVAAFGFRRQFVLNGTHPEYDRINALKRSQCSVRSREREFRLTSHRTAAVARLRSVNGLCDDEAVLLICPTCQVSAQSAGSGDRRLLCMGLFSIFLAGAAATPA
jgi:hypothetical protein